MGAAADRFADNPLFVLELTPGATRAEVERAGQKLLAMLAVGVGEAGRFATPVGVRARTETSVREAMAQLRDPDRRMRAELWWSAPEAAPDVETDARVDEIVEPVALDVLAALGWSGR